MLTISDPKRSMFSALSYIVFVPLPPDLPSTLPILNSCPILRSGNATIPKHTHLHLPSHLSTSPSAHQKEII